MQPTECVRVLVLSCAMSVAIPVSADGPISSASNVGRRLALMPAKLVGKTVHAVTALRANPEETIHFDLFTRAEPRTPTRIDARQEASVQQSTFDASKPTKIIIHGFRSHQGPGTGGDKLKNTFLAAQDCNVITVDWSAADSAEYVINVNVVLPRVANEVAELIQTLHGLGLSLDNVHILGHSLGGQMAGAAGAMVLGPAGAGRITGLDPAGPLFEGRDATRRLDPTDAAFVDVIHTDGGKLGYASPTGHVDFFPNGGMHVQSGCGADATGICSHCFVYDLIIDSLLNPGPQVYRACSSWQAYLNGECSAGYSAVMGIFTDTRSRGSYFLATSLPIRAELQKGGEQKIFSLSDLRHETPGKDGVEFLQC